MRAHCHLHRRRRRRTTRHIVGTRPWCCGGIQQSWTGIFDREGQQDDGPGRRLDGFGANVGVGGIVGRTSPLSFTFSSSYDGG